MKSHFFLFLFLAFGFSVQSQNVIFYKGTIEEAKQKSLSEGKALMVYIGADWCGYCKYTENIIFTRDTAYEYLNEHFICLKLDEKDKEAKKIKREYETEVLPAFIFYDSNGKYVRHFDGFMTAQQLKTEAEKALKKRKKLFKLNLKN